MELLTIENLCKFYCKGENQVTAIIGFSGSGKSTLFS